MYIFIYNPITFASHSCLTVRIPSGRSALPHCWSISSGSSRSGKTSAWSAVGLPSVPLLHRNYSPQGSGRYPICVGHRRRSCFTINVAWLVSNVWYGWPRYFFATPEDVIRYRWQWTGVVHIVAQRRTAASSCSAAACLLPTPRLSCVDCRRDRSSDRYYSCSTQRTYCGSLIVTICGNTCTPTIRR